MSTKGNGPLLLSLMTVDDLQDALPASFRTTKKELLDALKKSGCYREVLGKIALTPDDVAAFMDHLRAAPSPHQAAARQGAGRLLSGGRPAPHTVGYLVAIGEQLNHNGYVFLGWAPADDRGIADLLTLVQYGYPAGLVVMGFKPSTPFQVAEIKKQLVDWQVRTDDDNWYEYTGGAANYIAHVIKSKQSIVDLLSDDEEDNKGKDEQDARKGT